MAKIDDSVKKKVPELRFKGFTDEWEERKFGEIVQVSRGLTYKPSDVQIDGIRVLRSSNINEDVFILRDDDVFVKPDAVNIAPIKNGDILITSANGSSRLVGKHAIVNGLQDKTVHGGFMLRVKSKNTWFTNSLMSSRWYNYFINIYVSGGNGAIGNLRKYDLESQTIIVPDDEEQQKIGAFFKQLDDTIALHQRKLDLLKETKKGFLQKMFPKNGEKVPELRFEGFTDDWEERKLSEIGKIVTGNTPNTSNKDYYNGDFLFVSPADIQENRYVNKTTTTLTELGFKTGRLVPKGATLFVSIGSTIGKTGQSICDVITNQQINSVISFSDYDDDFIYTSILNSSTKIKQLAATQAVPIINKNEFGKSIIKIPSLEEQQKIGAFFKQLDDIIALHQRKLDLLKEQKKGFLQKMFV